MRLQKKSLSKINLLDLLRRKKSNLEKFLQESGIVTYDLLVNRCNSIGVVPPSEDTFLKAMGNPVVHNFSSPTEGIVVLNPPVGVEDQDEKSVTTSAVDAIVAEDLHLSKKKKRKNQNLDSSETTPVENDSQE